jgi:hypothetical protein
MHFPLTRGIEIVDGDLRFGCEPSGCAPLPSRRLSEELEKTFAGSLSSSRFFGPSFSCQFQSSPRLLIFVRTFGPPNPLLGWVRDPEGPKYERGLGVVRGLIGSQC